MYLLTTYYCNFVPAFWMLRPSRYDPKLGLWVWTPKYDEDPDVEDMDGAMKDEEENQFEMPIGSTIRFRVKSINFTQVTSSAKGMQATTTSTTSLNATTSTSNPSAGKTDAIGSFPVRKRSTSVDLTDEHKIPPCMHITASICEDGLGIISWWTTTQDNAEDPTELEE